MTKLQYERVGSRILLCEGLYLAVFDRCSPANSAEKTPTLLQQSRQQAGGDGGEALFAFNRLLADLGHAGELLAWSVLLDGVFRVEVRVLSATRTNKMPPTPDGYFAGGAANALLSCPSGEIMIEKLASLGENTSAPALLIAPGLYRAHITADPKQQSEHFGLEQEDQYPSADGPDWIVYLQRHEE